MDDARKIAAVTGAGRGIGRAVAIALAQGGYSVVLSGRRVEPLQQTAAECGDRARVVRADVSNPDDVRRMFAVIREKFGRIDLLFNNAGINARYVPMEELTYEEWKAVVDINLTGAFLCAQEAVRLMKEQRPQGGRIINNGSISAYAPRPHSAPYTATKHAMTGLTKSLSLDGRPFNIVCGQIDIGNVATEMTYRMAQGVPQADGSIRAEPLMEMRHVVDAVLYMANLPLEANVQFMTVLASGMPLIGRG